MPEPKAITDPDRSLRWWRNAVIYQIYPRSFQDSNGDGIGDIAGITRRLGYLKSLGVDGIWISPFFVSPMKDFGYDVADYRDVDPIFGTLEDFDILLDRAHSLGLKIMLDMVLSHTSDQHEWFIESRKDKTNPYADWYVWVDGDETQRPNNWLSVFGGSAWQYDPQRAQYYLHHWLKEQPDLNYYNPQVQDRRLDECRFWLDRGVDGFRLDVINFLTHDRELRDNPPRNGDAANKVDGFNPYHGQKHIHSVSQPETLNFLRRLRALADRYGDIFLLGEIFDDDNIARTAQYTEPAGPLHSAYSFAMLKRKMDLSVVETSVAEFRSAHPQGIPTWVFENHDVPRIVSRWTGPPTDNLPVYLLNLLLELQGTVILYQGQELGLPQASLSADQIQDPYGKSFDFEGRDGSRTPMPWSPVRPNAGFTTGTPWLPVDEAHFSLNVEDQLKDPGSMLNAACRLIRQRRAAVAQTSATTKT